ncbi:MAG: tRNA 2-thiouridine(34) synthase MnmA [Pleomorphochaeta sp.]|nr:tRNA 2-thiouridine(34) synthase MnmA [Sphaerochaetaceae bacterium]
MKVLVGMSGGIDSSVTAYLLKNAGYDVKAITMLLGQGNSELKDAKKTNYCFAPNKDEEIKKVKEICEKLEIESIILDLSKDFSDTVLQNFKDEYLSGRTPNPCVWCNSKIKFKAMLDEARNSGIEFDKFATGHYARIIEKNGRFCLYRGKDLKKDQSYFLYRLTQEQLSQIIFPLGELNKDEVRAIDVELGFHKEEQTESQDFYDGDYTELLNVESKVGNIVDKDGNILGKHKGLFNYTIGQRKGLGIAAERPLYVLELDTVRNEVVVGFQEATYNNVVEAKDIVWGSRTELNKEKLQAKIRSTGYPSSVIASSYLNENGEMVLRCEFEEKIQAATLGQSLVIYDGDEIVAGGIISNTI